MADATSRLDPCRHTRKLPVFEFRNEPGEQRCWRTPREHLVESAQPQHMSDRVLPVEVAAGGKVLGAASTIRKERFWNLACSDSAGNCDGWATSPGCLGVHTHHAGPKMHHDSLWEAPRYCGVFLRRLTTTPIRVGHPSEPIRNYELP